MGNDNLMEIYEIVCVYFLGDENIDSYGLYISYEVAEKYRAKIEKEITEERIKQGYCVGQDAFSVEIRKVKVFCK